MNYHIFFDHSKPSGQAGKHPIIPAIDCLHALAHHSLNASFDYILYQVYSLPQKRVVSCILASSASQETITSRVLRVFVRIPFGGRE